MESALLEFARQYGPWAAFCILMFLSCGWLVRYVLASCDRRETALQQMINDQYQVIKRQSDSVNSQSEALNRLADKIGDLDRSVARIENNIETRVGK